MRRLIIGLLMLAGIIGAGSYARAQEAATGDLADIRRMMDEAATEMFAPGEPIPDWETSGADLLAAMAAATGGLAGNAAVTSNGKGETSATYFGTGPGAIAIPAAWTMVKEYGRAPPPGVERSTSAMTLDGPYVIVTEGAMVRRGNALCARGLGHYRVYRVPGRPAGTMPEAIALLVTDVLDKAVGDRLVCEVYEPITGGFRVRAINGDGRALPRMDAQEPDVMRIVPRAPIEQLLFGSN